MQRISAELNFLILFSRCLRFRLNWFWVWFFVHTQTNTNTKNFHTHTHKHTKVHTPRSHLHDTYTRIHPEHILKVYTIHDFLFSITMCIRNEKKNKYINFPVSFPFCFLRVFLFYVFIKTINFGCKMKFLKENHISHVSDMNTRTK